MKESNIRLPFGIPRDLGVVAIGMLFWGLGEGLFIFFYPLSIQRWDADTVQIGAILSMLGVTMALVQVPAGYLSDRFGPRLLIRAGLIVGVIAAVIMGFAQELPIFIVGLVAYTLTSFIGAPLNSYITRKRGDWSVQRAITFVSGAAQVGGILGPILGGLIAQTFGLAVVFRYSAGIFLAATIIIFFARKSVTQQEESESIVQRLNPLRNPRFIGLIVLIFITIIAISTPQQLTSVYLQDIHHLSLQQIGTTGTFAGIGAAVIMFTLGNLRAPLGMIVGQLLIGLFAFFIWRGESVSVFYCGYLFIGGYRLYRSMAMAVARPMVMTSHVGLAYGLVETGNALAVILAPLAAGFLYDHKPVSVYTVSLILLGITIASTMLLAPKKKPII